MKRKRKGKCNAESDQLQACSCSSLGVPDRGGIPLWSPTGSVLQQGSCRCQKCCVIEWSLSFLCDIALIQLLCRYHTEKSRKTIGMPGNADNPHLPRVMGCRIIPKRQTSCIQQSIYNPQRILLVPGSSGSGGSKSIPGRSIIVGTIWKHIDTC